MMKLLKFKTVQPKGYFLIPESSFVSYRCSDEGKLKRNSGTLVYKSSYSKTSQIEVIDEPIIESVIK